MDLGYFMMPAHPPKRKPYDFNQYDLQSLRWGDELDVVEAWFSPMNCAYSSPRLLDQRAPARQPGIVTGCGGARRL
jgi:hypothetical protein